MSQVAKANAELYKVYMVLAERLEAEGPARADEALDMFTRALEAAKKSWNKGRSISIIYHRHTPYTIHHTPYTIHHPPYTIHQASACGPRRASRRAP